MMGFQLMSRVLLALLSLASLACAHTIEFNNNTFFSPVTGQEFLSGSVSVASNNVTPVTVVDDITNNPPLRSGVHFEDIEGILSGSSVSNLEPNANLTLISGVDVFIGNTVNGVRWQFLRAPFGWVGAVQAGISDRTDETSKTSQAFTATSTAKIKTTETGISIGYQFPTVVAYASYVTDKHNTSTTVTNASGSFGPYADSGEHTMTSVGLASTTPGFYYGIEHSFVDLVWNSVTKAKKTATGFRIGYMW
ncbi:MAG: hypothetical protein RJB66_1780 [Pseudomonadota bacterium]|jgi:hypothetical protein